MGIGHASHGDSARHVDGDERRCIVDEPFAAENDYEASREVQCIGDRLRSDGVGWSDEITLAGLDSR